MTSFTNFHSQFRGLVERAMLSELEDMLRMIAEALRRLDGDSAAHAERAAEALHAARRRENRVREESFHRYHPDYPDAWTAPRYRIDVPRAACPWCNRPDGPSPWCSAADRCPPYGEERAAGNLPV